MLRLTCSALQYRIISMRQSWSSLTDDKSGKFKRRIALEPIDQVPEQMQYDGDGGITSSRVDPPMFACSPGREAADGGPAY